MTPHFESYIGKYCRVEFRFSNQPDRIMDYEGVVDRVIRDTPQEDHLVLNIRYGGRTPILLNSIVSIEEIFSE